MVTFFGTLHGVCSIPIWHRLAFLAIHNPLCPWQYPVNRLPKTKVKLFKLWQYAELINSVFVISIVMTILYVSSTLFLSLCFIVLYFGLEWHLYQREVTQTLTDICFRHELTWPNTGSAISIFYQQEILGYGFIWSIFWVGSKLSNVLHNWNT